MRYRIFHMGKGCAIFLPYQYDWIKFIGMFGVYTHLQQDSELAVSWVQNTELAQC